MAYLNRGLAKEGMGDLDAAMRDYNRALAIDPKDTGAYNNRANIKLHKGDIDGATADYNRALQLDPKNASVYHNRGAPEVIKGDVGRAVADFNHALQLNPKLDGSYWGRGNANFIGRDWAAALRDYHRFCELSRRNEEYPRLAIWMIRSRLGEREAADKELAAHFSAEPGTWPSKIQAYVLGKLSENEFLAAMSPDLKLSPGQRCEGWFYAGMKNLLDGNKTAAAEFFKKCVATGQRSVVEHAFAKAELKALGQ